MSDNNTKEPANKLYVCTKHELAWAQGEMDLAEQHFEKVCPRVNVVVAYLQPAPAVA